MKLKMEGIGELEQLAEVFNDKAKRREIAPKFIKAMVTRCESVTKKNTPRDTGTLINSWRTKVNGKGEEISAEFYNVAEYAPYVEYGHRTRNHKGFIEGRHMLRKGLNSVRASRKYIAREIIKREFGK